MVSMEIILKLVSLKFWTLLQGSLNAVGAVGAFSVAVPKAILDVCRFSQICLLCFKVSGHQSGSDLVPQLPPGVPFAWLRLHNSFLSLGSFFFFNLQEKQKYFNSFKNCGRRQKIRLAKRWSEVTGTWGVHYIIFYFLC